jgi:hypothetical protein
MHDFGGLFILCATVFFFVGWQQKEKEPNQLAAVHTTTYQSKTKFMPHSPLIIATVYRMHEPDQELTLPS